MSLYLGIDIGGTKIACGIVTEAGEVLRQFRCPTPLTGSTSILNAALALASKFCNESFTAIGIGTGGQVNSDTGVIVSATNLLPGWAGTDVKAAFETEFNLPCFVDNDVNALAVGESRFGNGQNLSTVIFLALGTGVGGALLLNGRLHHGAHWTGGEFGHLLLTTDEAATRRTLEEYVSGPGLIQTYREMSGFGGSITGEIIAEQAGHNPESHAAKAITQTGIYLGYGLVSLANILDPDLFVIGGGLAAVGDGLLGPARRILAQYALPGPARCPVVPAALGADASLIGAAALAIGVNT
ncbi:MAG: ROK family protein [Janthinobacterium lividum]